MGPKGMGEIGDRRVRRLGPGDVENATGVLTDAFLYYPVMRFVVGDAGSGYRERVEAMMRYFVTARFERNEPIVGVGTGELLVGVALVSRPGKGAVTTELAAMRERLWALLGGEARLRYEHFGRSLEAFEPSAPHIHLNMIGVRRTMQGGGFGRLLMDAVHAISVADPHSTGVSLNTEHSTNVPLYERFGYRVVGESEFAPGFQSWTMFRNDAPGDAIESAPGR